MLIDCLLKAKPYLASFFYFIFITNLLFISNNSSAQVPEHVVKVEFTYKIINFIKWPIQNSQSNNFLISYIGENSVTHYLKERLQGKRFRKKKIVVEPYESSKLTQTRIIFVSRNGLDAFEHLIPALQNRPILIIGESPGFASQQGIINFYVRHKKVAFEINHNNAKQRGLFISSRLLGVARIIE